MKHTGSGTSNCTKVLKDESNKVTDQKNHVTYKKKKITDESYTVSDETTINQLNDDCLVNIFTFLPVADRICIQRVCKRWQNISQIPWSDKKRLVLFDKTWSSNFPDNFDRYLYTHDRIKNGVLKNKNRLLGIKNVLKLCGQYVIHIKFNCFESTLEIYKEIKKRCPNLQSLDHSERSITHDARTKYILNNFHSLRHFELGSCSSPTDVHLINFFKNNPELKSLGLYGFKLPRRCFSFLPKSLEDFSFHEFKSEIHPDLIYQSLSRLSNLSTLSLGYFNAGTRLDVDEALKALPLNSSIKKLTLKTDLMWKTPLGSMYWARLKNLECLELRGKWILNIKEAEVIIDHCQKLSQIIIDDVLTSTTALASILAMPNLRTLILINIYKLQDKHFYEETNVEELEIHCCKNISKLGLMMLSKKAKNLKILKIFAHKRLRWWYEPMKIKQDDIQNIFKKNIKIYMDEQLLN